MSAGWLLLGPAGAGVATAQTATSGAAPSSKASASKAAAPDEAESDDDAPTTVKSVTVTARRKPIPYKDLPGAVVGDILPEEQFSPADIASFGVSTVTDLLTELAPESRSDRGRGGESPVVLLNGRRISGLNEIQNIPTEAILRVDILPEEVSLKYGYTADQRVINIVLRRRFRAVTGEVAGGGPTEGGQVSGQGEGDLLTIRRDDRLNLDLKYTGQSNLTEADRDLTSAEQNALFDLAGNVLPAGSASQIDPALSALAGAPVTVAGVPAAGASRPLSLADFAGTANQPNVTDVASYRTLLPATQSVSANAVLARPLPWGVRATGNATLGATTSDSLQGLPGASLTIPNGDPFSPFSQPIVLDRYVSGLGPLRQSVDGWTAHLGSTLNKDPGDWRLSLTDAYDHSDTQTDTDAGVNAALLQAPLDALSPGFNPFAPFPSALVASLPEDRAHVASDAANIQVLGNGPLAKLKAGALYASLKLGDTQTWLSSTSQRLGAFQAVSLTRNDANAQANLDLPLTSREHHVLGFIGDLSVNLNLAADQLSDFGFLPTLGYGLNWTPVEGVNLIVSHTLDHAAPTVQQLGGPTVLTPGVLLFDYSTGRSVDVTQISGGEAGLKADTRNVLKVGLTLKPFPTQNFTFTANYIDSRIDNAIATFPAANAQIEAAFPDRFLRDADGDLEEEDERPVNYASEQRRELRYGLVFSRPLGPQPPPRNFRRFHRPRPDAGPATAEADAQPGGANASRAEGGAGGATGTSAATPPGPDAAGGGGGDRDGGGGHGGNGGGRGYGGGRGFGPGGRLQLAIYHTVFFEDQQLIRAGGPVLDLLDGASAGATGGQPQHEIEAQLGATLFGFGARLSADWKSATTVRSAPGTAAGDLDFSDIGTINLRLFDNLGQQPPVVRRLPWLRGSRVSLNIVNLFDSRIGVRDSAGATPLIYQPAYLDPAGRTVRLSLRKLFF